MESWSSFKEFCLLHKREIKLYAIGVGILICGVKDRQWLLAWIGLGWLLVLFCYDRWGGYWADRGKDYLRGTSTNKPKS